MPVPPLSFATLHAYLVHVPKLRHRAKSENDGESRAIPLRLLIHTKVHRDGFGLCSQRNMPLLFPEWEEKEAVLEKCAELNRQGGYWLDRVGLIIRRVF